MVCSITQYDFFFARQRDYLLRAREMLALLPMFASQRGTYARAFASSSYSEAKLRRTPAEFHHFREDEPTSAGSSPWRPSSVTGLPLLISILMQMAGPIVVSRFGPRRAPFVPVFWCHVNFWGTSALLR